MQHKTPPFTDQRRKQSTSLVLKKEEEKNVKTNDTL
jgi:hypothetical protein